MDTVMRTHAHSETLESPETQAPERTARGYEPEPPPELYSIDGAVPPDVLEARAQWLDRNPRHPGRSLDLMRERKSLGIPEVAAQLGVAAADLAAVLECREPITLDLALRLEDAGWDTAEGWLRWQVDHDIAAERRRRAARHADASLPKSVASPCPDADPVAASA